jgi:hypothetical protein
MAAATSTRSGISRRLAPATGAPNVDAQVWSVEYATGELEASDVMEMGYVPAGTVIGFFMYSDDLDTNGTPALVRKITVGSTDVATGLTYGQTASGGFVAIEPVTVTTPTLVKVTVTTAAATAAAGTTVLVPLYLGK